MGGCSSLTSLFIEDFLIQHREVEKQGRSKLHERKHRIFTLYLLDFVICHVFIGRSLSPSAEWYHTCGQARAWWRTGGGCGCWSTRCVWGPCTGQPTSSGRGSAWPSPPPSTRGTPRCSHSRGGYQTRVPAVCTCGGQLRRGHGVSHPGETRVLPGVGLGGHHAVERWSGCTCHVSRVSMCRAVGRLRSLRGLGRGSVRRHAGSGAAAALRHPHSALCLRGPGTQPR